MPIKNGLECMNEIKQLYEQMKLDGKSFIEPEYVFLTGFSSESLQKYLNSVGVNHCYEKPVDKETLTRIIF